MTEKETFGEPEITCPNCHKRFMDSFESEDEGEDTCSECGCTFTFYRDVSVTYSSKLIKLDDNSK